MKRLLVPVLLAFSILVHAEVGATTGAAPVYSSGSVWLDTGRGVVHLTSAAGIGFKGKGPPQAKNAKPLTPTPVDVRFAAEKSEAFSRTLSYLSGKATTMDAAVQVADHNYQVKQRMDLGVASILEIELPGADASESKKRADIRMRLQPKSLTFLAGAGAIKADGAKGKGLATLSNFRVALDGVDMPQVVEVSPATVRRVGGDLDISGLSVTLPQNAALSGGWMEWAQDTVANGEGGKGSEKVLTVTYLDLTLKNTLLVIQFTGVGIESMEVPLLAGGSEAKAMVTFHLYARDVGVK